MTWSPQNNLVAALTIASVPGELPLNPCWFCGGACGPRVTCEHALQAACCGPSAARRQPGGVEEASGGKVLVCKSGIPNPIPLGFCPGSRFYRSLLSLIGFPGPRCQRQRDGVEPDFFLLFFPNPYCQEPHLLKLLRRRWKSRGTRPCTCCTSILVISQPCQHKHRSQPRLSALITRWRGRTYGWAVAASCARRQLANLLVLQDFSGNKPEGKTSLVR